MKFDMPPQQTTMEGHHTTINDWAREDSVKSSRIEERLKLC